MQHVLSIRGLLVKFLLVCISLIRSCRLHQRLIFYCLAPAAAVPTPAPAVARTSAPAVGADTGVDSDDDVPAMVFDEDDSNSDSDGMFSLLIKISN